MKPHVYKVSCVILLAGLWFIPLAVRATHIRAADIKVVPDCINPRTFKITVVAYLNTQSNTLFGTNSQVFFGDGAFVRIPLSAADSRPDLGPHVAVATFTIDHIYFFDGTYTVSYIERDRSSGILNIENSDDVPYVTSVSFVVNSGAPCNHYPVLSVPPLDKACFGVAFLHSPGAYDVDGDSLSYQMTVPKNDLNTFANYTSPISNRFYTQFNNGNEDKTGPPVFFIGPVSGILTWDAPGMQGEYNIAFNVTEWRKDSLSGVYKILSVTTRDMQIVVEECNNIRPELAVPVDICIEAGTKISELILGTDEENHPVRIEVFSEVLELGNMPASYSPNPPQFISSDPEAQLNFEWTTSCIHVREQPYQIVFKITDDPPDGPKLVNFKIWNIKVLAPPPTWQALDLNLVNRSAELTWDSYTCTNASKLQIWRRVDSYPYSPAQCETGLPKFLGFSLIAQVDPLQLSYIDTNQGRGLAAGAKYCYRIMAYFNSPANTPSVVSTEMCLGPIQADAPVITHVSVETTSDAGGIRVSWRSPFNINQTQFPRPYEYEVYRAIGFAGDSVLSKAGRVQDTSFLDAGINTDKRIFNYRVVLYSQPKNASSLIPVDTSAIASAVRLTAIPGVKNIQLAWRDSVPWSNVAQTRPHHLVYRGIENSDPAKMILIDSVNVVENGFTYTDHGQFKNEAIEDDQRYSYRILTRGTYGNVDINLQENFSQVVTSFPVNDLLPCNQVLAINLVKCDEYLTGNNCDQREFSNTIHWGIQERRGCRKDVAAYNIYSSASPSEPFQRLATNVKDTLFIDRGLPSFARCYKVSALDRNGMESLLSDSVCNDNCPYYMLPNVFTPNGDGYNDTFNASFDKFLSGKVITEGPVRCPRFVTSISMKVYNRWGKEVYHYTSDDVKLITIDWDGKDPSGNLLETGVYFYSAEVAFDVMDPTQRRKEIKGWVHLMR